MTTPVIELRNVTKSFRTPGGGRKHVLRNACFAIPPRKIVGVLGRNGAGKSTTLRVIAGTQDYDSGEIIRRGSVSWPVGFAGSFHGELSGAQNTRFIARVYGVDTDDLLEFVREFSELGPYLDMPCKTYSSGMRARLAFGISMGGALRHLPDGRSDFGRRCLLPAKVQRDADTSPVNVGGLVRIALAQGHFGDLRQCDRARKRGRSIFRQCRRGPLPARGKYAGAAA